MPFTIVKLIGSGQVFTTLQSWEDGAPADLTTAEQSAAGTFLVAAFTQGETLSFVGSGATGKFLDTDSTGAGNGTYVSYGITSGNPTSGDVVTGATSGATCVLSSSTPTATGCVWQGQINSASDAFSGSANLLTVTGSTTSSTAYKELTTKTGAGFNENASVQSNALKWNASNGCSITVSGNNNAVSLEENYARLSNQQIQKTGTGGTANFCLKIATDGIIVQRCILENGATLTSGRVISSHAVTPPSVNTTIANCLVYSITASLVHLMSLGSGGVDLINCTFAVPSDVTAAASLASSNLDAPNSATNCAAFGITNCSTVLDPYTTCLGNDASPPTGMTTLAYDTTTGSGFEGITNADKDFRIKSTSAMLDVGTTSSTYGGTDIAFTARPQGSAYDVGCWEFVAAAGGRTTKNTRSWPLGVEVGMGWRMAV